jgi:hypothetical protein
MKGNRDEEGNIAREGRGYGRTATAGEPGSDGLGSDDGGDSDVASSGLGQVLERSAVGGEQRSDADELVGWSRVEVSEQGCEVSEGAESAEAHGEQYGEESLSPQDSHASVDGEDSGNDTGEDAVERTKKADNVVPNLTGLEVTKPYKNPFRQGRQIPNRMQWKPGQSGNPSGRPKGSFTDKVSKNKLQHLLNIMGNDAEKIIKKAIKKALDDNDKDQGTMLKLLIDRLVPATKAVEVTGLGGRELALKVLVEGIETHNQINQLDISDAKVIN